MFKPGGLFGPKPGKAALDQAMGGSASTGGSSGGSSGTSINDDKKGGDEKGYGGSGFDPRGLERAAKAAKVSAPTQAPCRVCQHSSFVVFAGISSSRALGFGVARNMPMDAWMASVSRSLFLFLSTPCFLVCT